MTEKSVSPVAAAEEKIVTKMETTKKVGAPKAPAKPRIKPNHPSTADMVKAAIKTLADRGGSSLQAIKKYITVTYKIDAEKQAPFIKKYLKAAVTAGTLVQTKGKGASGSFKLAVKKADAPKSKPKAVTEKKVVKPKKPTSPKKTPVKKADATKAAAKKPPASPKKPPVKRVAAGEKKAATVKSAAIKSPKPKAPSKTKKVMKSPTAKPKAPKPKKVVTPKAAKPAAAKKPAAQKK